MARNLLLPALVVSTALIPAVNTAHRHNLWLVEVRDRLVVLTLSILHDQGVVRIERVDGKSSPPRVRSGVADEPLKRVLPLRLLVEDLVTEVDHVRLV